METKIEVQGQCDSRFSAVEEAFRENFASKGEVGSSTAVYAGGKLVVDLWGGYADAARTRHWEHDTLVTVYSTTKGMTAICAHRLADQGNTIIVIEHNMDVIKTAAYIIDLVKQE